MSQRSPAPSVGRFTGIVLGFVVFVCVTMIGGTGYLKYQLDRAESLLAAPDAAVGSDQDLFDRLRRDLGYGGFLGLAQNYALAHDPSGFAEMKAHIKSADEIVAHLPDKTPAETRHELASIVTVYDAALQKINAPANDTTNEFTAADLTPLYAALPILDARVSSANGETRLSAQNHLQFWAMLLTLVSWCSLIIAAACAAGIYLTIRDKHSAPMRALAQSIQNMARGDMRTAIWGTERQDMIGELARSVDIARYHFSHLPDVSLISDQGPVRMRFEGGSRSLFEAMMKTISRDSENIRDQTALLTQAMQSQKETLTVMSSKVEHVLENIFQHGQNGDQQIRQAIQEMVGSAENLKNAHAHAADQLNRLIPHIQDRAQGMAEIAHITGKQIGQTLQSLAASEAGIKANADQAKETLNRLFSTADDLGERLFGAINLLQASGKVLAETTQNMQGGSSAGIEHVFTVPASLDHTILEPLTQRLEQITDQLSILQTKMDTPPSIIESPSDTSHTSYDFSQLLATISEKIEQQKDALVSHTALLSSQTLESMSELNAAFNQRIEQQKDALVSHTALLSSQTLESMTDLNTSISQRIEQQKDAIVNQTSFLTSQTRESVTELSSKITSLTTSLPGDLRQSLQNDIYSLGAQIESLRSFSESVASHKTDDDAQKIYEKISIIQNSIEKLSAPDIFNMPPHILKQFDEHWYQMAAQIEASRASLDKTISEQVGGKLSGFLQALEMTKQAVETIKGEISIIEGAKSPTGFDLPPDMLKKLDAHWYQMAAQIEASRSSLVETIANEVSKIEHKLSGKPDALTRSAADYATQRQIEQQTQILSELVATLGVLDAHMQQIKLEMRATAH
jgi:hypothetical protein